MPVKSTVWNFDIFGYEQFHPNGITNILLLLLFRSSTFPVTNHIPYCIIELYYVELRCIVLHCVELFELLVAKLSAFQSKGCVHHLVQIRSEKIKVTEIKAFNSRKVI